MKKILIVCGAGGAIQLESAAGALKALDESGVLEGAELSYMSCSGGAPVAALHASGVTGEGICNIIKNNPMSNLLTMPITNFSRYASAEGVYNVMVANMPSEPLTNCRVALTRMTEGENVAAVMADATPATVVASMSIQGIFQPVIIGGEPYGDGGVLNMIPTPKISEINDYDHVYFIISPVSEAKNEPYKFFDYELKALTNTLNRELTGFYENGWDDLPNVTVIEPAIPATAEGQSVFEELLAWTPDYVMLDAAYEYTKAKINTED